MSLAIVVVAGVAGGIGVLLMMFGLAAVDAGRGGYGMGPVPFLRVPRDNGLILVGIVITLIGVVLLASAWTVITT